jgi:TonB family protein
MNQSLRRYAVQGALILAALMIFVPLSSRAQESPESSRRIVTRTAPNYPPVAHQLEIRGSVKVEALVSPNGTVKAVEVKGGHPMLAQAAQEAVRQWKWEPSSKESREVVEIKFIWQ